MKWDAVFFDFDGVILDSTNIKTSAFAQMFRQYGKQIEQRVVDYHLKNQGISRYEKFKYFYQNLLMEKITDDELIKLGDNFSQIALKGVLDAPFIKGTLETLEKLLKFSIPAYIVSGTPDNEIQLIVKKRNLSKYFKGIHGSPRLKEDIINAIIKTEGYESEKCILFGDSITDYHAAKKTGIQFSGIVKYGELSPFPPDIFVMTRVEL